MSYSAEIIDYKGKEAIELTAGKYKAVVAPFLGSNVLRMQDVENDIEIFRYDESLSIEEASGRVRTSDLVSAKSSGRWSFKGKRCYVSFSVERSAWKPYSWIPA